MREHAIPQDITGYRFHIIGNMTIKQFAEIGVGVFVGFLIYNTNLPVFVKWPLVFIVVGLGAMAAFVPIEERPLDHWVSAFIKVLYKPTKFFWRRIPKIPDPFLYTPSDQNTVREVEFDLRPAKRERIREYLRSVQTPEKLNPFDLTEQIRIASIMTTFTDVVVQHVDVEARVQRPNLKVRVRTLISQPQEIAPDFAPVQLLPEMDYDPTLAPPFTTPETVVYASDQASSRLNTTQVANDIQIPITPSISYAQPQSATENSPAVPPTTEIIVEAGAQIMPDARAYVESVAATNNLEVTQQAVTNADLPFPSIPTEPNKVVGMVLRPNHELINDAIIEVQTTDGRVVRAVKSNALGQFFITTPLESGSYTLLVECDGFEFAPLQLILDGSVILPVEIRSIA